MGTSQSTQTNRVIRPENIKEEVPESFGIVKMAPKHFSHGTCRLAYKGKLLKTGLGPGTMLCDEREQFVGWKSYFNRAAREEYYPCVVKVFKQNFPAMRQDQWKFDIQNLMLTKDFSEKFNDGPASQSNKKITVATPLLARVDRLGESSFLFFSWFNDNRTVGEWVLVEPFLDGKFEKFNSNNGWVNSDVNAKLAIAFSHFTWHESNGEYCITDMQGLRGKDNGNYILSDPAVQSKVPGTFGPTDLGFFGVRAFFSTHECNEFCRGLRKPKFGRIKSRHQDYAMNNSSDNWKNVKRSSYTWEVPDIANERSKHNPFQENVVDSIELLLIQRKREATPTANTKRPKK